VKKVSITTIKTVVNVVQDGGPEHLDAQIKSQIAALNKDTAPPTRPRKRPRQEGPQTDTRTSLHQGDATQTSKNGFTSTTWLRRHRPAGSQQPEDHLNPVRADRRPPRLRSLGGPSTTDGGSPTSSPGTNGTAQAPFNKGRTANTRRLTTSNSRPHPPRLLGSDMVADTPNRAGPNTDAAVPDGDVQQPAPTGTCS
jgi:hypothetical protein